MDGPLCVTGGLVGTACPMLLDGVLETGMVEGVAIRAPVARLVARTGLVPYRLDQRKKVSRNRKMLKKTKKMLNKANIFTKDKKYSQLYKPI